MVFYICGFAEAAPPNDPSHLQPSNPDSIADAKKHLLTGAWFGCPLRGSASIWQMQMHIDSIIGLSLGTPLEELGTEELKGFVIP